jgi:hypothetical protein
MERLAYYLVHRILFCGKLTCILPCTFPRIGRLMKAQTLGDTSNLEFMRGRRIFEINPDHPIVKERLECKDYSRPFTTY